MLRYLATALFKCQPIFELRLKGILFLVDHYHFSLLHERTLLPSKKIVLKLALVNFELFLIVSVYVFVKFGTASIELVHLIFRNVPVNTNRLNVINFSA